MLAVRVQRQDAGEVYTTVVCGDTTVASDDEWGAKERSLRSAATAFVGWMLILSAHHSLTLAVLVLETGTQLLNLKAQLEQLPRSGSDHAKQVQGRQTRKFAFKGVNP